MKLGGCQASTLLWWNGCFCFLLVQLSQFFNSLSRGCDQVARYSYRSGVSCQVSASFFYSSLMRTLSMRDR